MNKPVRHLIEVVVLVAVFSLQLTAVSSTNSGVGSSAPIPGPSSTLLPDGRLLLLGGTSASGPGATALINNPADGSTVILAQALSFARTGHSATMLPNGKVLVLGGIGSDGKVVSQTELFDPNTQSFSLLQLAPAARAFHTATVLTDGKLAIIGGVGPDGVVQATVALWNYRDGTTSSVAAQLNFPRWNHTASLLADGTVQISGGKDNSAAPVNQIEIFNPQSKTIEVQPSITTDAASAALTEIVASMPIDGASQVPQDAFVALRFSQLIQVQSVSQNSVLLMGAEGAIDVNIIPAESGRLAFIVPKRPLQPGNTYTISLAGALDEKGAPVAYFQASFTTAGQPPANGLNDGEQWLPDPENFNGLWTSGRPKSASEFQDRLYAPAGVTAVSGLVLALNGKPLPNVTLQIGTNRTRTDGTGRFLLVNVPAGHQVLIIDGTSANTPLKRYGVFENGIDIKKKQTNVLPYTIWIPMLDMAHALKIPSPTKQETVITNPAIPGLEVHLPPGAVIYDRQGKIVTQVSITPIPTDRPPFPLPLGLQIPTYFTVQPGGAYIVAPNKQGARLIYPNYTHMVPGSRIGFWNYDPNVRGWYVYGKGTVNSGGTQAVPDPGVMVLEFTGAMIDPYGHGPSPTPPCPDAPSCRGDPVDTSTGIFTYEKTDLSLSDVLPLALTRSSRQADPNLHAFGIGTNHPYDIFLTRYGYTNYNAADVVLADGTLIHYDCISGCTNWGTAQYQHITTPTRFYGSTMVWNGNGWTITLKDGSKYIFPENNTGINSIQDRYGNTITITHDSSQRVTQVTSPNGRWIKFTYGSSACSACITQATDSIGRTVNYAYDASNSLIQVWDTNSGFWQYTYDSQHEMSSVTDAKGIIHLQVQYDSNGRAVLETMADASTYQFAYQAAGSLSSSTPIVTQATVTDPRGNVEQLTFNGSGFLTADTVAANVPSLSQTTTYVRGSICNGTSTNSNFTTGITDALSRQTTYTYDCNGKMTSVTKLAGTSNAVTTSFTYEPTFKQLASIIDPLQHTTTFSYDTSGNLITASDPLTHQTTFGYNSAGQITSITDAMQNPTQLSYNATHDLVGITDPTQKTVTRQVDGVGRLSAITDPLGNTTRYQYDALNQLLQITDARQGVTAFSYDPNGNLLSLTDADNHATTYSYDNKDRGSSRTDPLHRVESFQHDGNGNLTRTTDRRGKVRSEEHTSELQSRRDLVCRLLLEKKK